MDNRKDMTKEEIEKAAQQYAHNHFNMHESNNYKALVQGFEAGARLKIVQLQQLQSENERLKSELLGNPEQLKAEREWTIDFDGKLMAGIKIVNGELSVIGAMDGYGNGLCLSDIIVKPPKQ